jgi:coenzyme F420-reducing hydrogenase alpha subunit
MGGKTVPVKSWHDVTNEYVSEQSTAKWTKWHRESYAVGALARFNNNAELMNPLAKDVAKMFGLEKGNCNPYMNNIAQVVECVHVVEESLRLIDELLTAGLKEEKVSSSPRAGKGAGCVEAPRGILFHEYEFDKDGKCVAADICIPTNQNHANIQKDFEKLLPWCLERGDSEDDIRLKMEMLVRSYDPCISCSTHMLNVNFVK